MPTSNTPLCTDDDVAERWRAGCECARAGLCYRCQAASEIERLNQRLQQMTERKDAVNETLRLVVEERNRLREALAVRDRENGALADAYLSKMGIKPEDLR